MQSTSRLIEWADAARKEQNRLDRIDDDAPSPTGSVPREAWPHGL